jgi:GH25 family lysozyme M1 (1,4-beta-N-acetylmuramidase)
LTVDGPVEEVEPVPEDAHPGVKSAGRPWGIDVSAWQHPDGADVNWRAVFAGGPATTPFVFVKTSEGMSAESNPYAATDRANARAAGALVGTYHYARPSVPVVESATAQARFAASLYGPRATSGMLPLALDLESNPNGLSRTDLATWALTFLAEVDRLTGRTPLLYTYPAFFAENVDPDPAFARYPLWIAHYGLALNSPTVPRPWTAWTFWQFSSKGQRPGVLGGVDLNTFAGTGARLSLLAGVLPRPAGVAACAPVTGPLAGQALLDGLLGRS